MKDEFRSLDVRPTRDCYACEFCHHGVEQHRPHTGSCVGRPADPAIDAGGECPCNDYVFHEPPTWCVN